MHVETKMQEMQGKAKTHESFLAHPEKEARDGNTNLYNDLFRTNTLFLLYPTATSSTIWCRVLLPAICACSTACKY
jgi:hypothetical protein